MHDTGSEYANTTTTSTTNSVNAITGLRKHRHNPDGIFCTTPGCNKGDHDYTHCYGKGGGIEGQAPWMRNKKKDNTKAVAAAATTAATTPAVPSAPSVPVIAAAIADLTSLMHDLSFASVTEIPDVTCATNLPFSTILNSGTTVTLVKDHRFFHTYSTEEPVDVLTANHGVLQTTGRELV
ncbi:hypothetical protein DFJ58DRAFT_840380 [Suillus subalutaceus]|uniref:uncharacterized protein n=1 Tax=Suillus subalutaceus TaxID=48586 RepID=UPI001B872DF3|nr:uncharacterized protein DFJ58DRAFT_840380 [Suillus subalutaceus]KAG1858797.1 hypothetical protein DFJ58DRAFT_840380 [Suillus subalutaceus]